MRFSMVTQIRCRMARHGLTVIDRPSKYTNSATGDI